LREAVEGVLAADTGASVLLLSCIDLRYPRRILETMDDEGYRGRYYHLALAGASHAAAHNEAWAQTFNDHLDFAVAEGGAVGVVILDHLDCAAFRVYEGIPAGDLERERERHHTVAKGAIAGIVRRHPRLTDRVYALPPPAESKPERIGHV
jgi:hypothetical protein